MPKLPYAAIQAQPTYTALPYCSISAEPSPAPFFLPPFFLRLPPGLGMGGGAGAGGSVAFRWLVMA